MASAKDDAPVCGENRLLEAFALPGWSSGRILSRLAHGGAKRPVDAHGRRLAGVNGRERRLEGTEIFGTKGANADGLGAATGDVHHAALEHLEHRGGSIKRLAAKLLGLEFGRAAANGTEKRAV